MKFLTRLNVCSACYAFLLFISTELLLNVYRISRLTGVNLGLVNNTINISIAIGCVLFSMVIPFFVSKWLESRNANLWSVVLWIPYYALFVFTFASLFPMTNPGDAPSPGLGFILFGIWMIYPIYLFFLISFGIGMKKKYELSTK